MKRKTPPERKADEYANEYRYEAWKSPHADRRNRPLKKALEQRQRRRQIRQVLPTTPASVGSDLADELTTAATPVRQPSLRHSSTAVPLAEHLRRNQDRRLRAVGRKHFGGRYDSKTHRKRFTRFLENVASGGTADSVYLAGFFRDLLEDPGPSDAMVARFRDSLRRLIPANSASEDYQYFRQLLSAPDSEFLSVYLSWTHSPSVWLGAFLRDAPEWRERLEQWIAATLSPGQ
jgi:hypothetical protein